MSSIILTLKEKKEYLKTDYINGFEKLIKNIETIVEEQFNKINNKKNKESQKVSDNNFFNILQDDSEISDDLDNMEYFCEFEPFENDYDSENYFDSENDNEINVFDIDILGKKYYKDDKSKLIFNKDHTGAVGECVGYFKDNVPFLS